MSCFLLTKEDIEGKIVHVMGREVLVDRYGYWLYQEHVWQITYSNFYVHRRDGKRTVIAFYRQLLNVPRSEYVSFVNGNRFDYRVINLNASSVDFILDPLCYKQNNIHCWCYNKGYPQLKRKLINNSLQKSC